MDYFFWFVTAKYWGEEWIPFLTSKYNCDNVALAILSNIVPDWWLGCGQLTLHERIVNTSLFDGQMM